MKKLDMMKGLLSKPKLPHLADGAFLTSGQNPFGQGSAGTAANITSSLANNPAAGSIGLGVPDGMGPSGQQFQQVIDPNTLAGISGGLASGATQASSQQQALSNMLMQQAQGQGPNPAQAMLNQATGKNVANQAALMASQRGASANPALMARQAAMQGAGIEQQAAGQAATLGAQQQLAAQSQLAGLSNQQIGAQQNANAQNISMQGNMNSANAGLAQTLAQARAAQFGGNLQGMGAQQAVNSQGTGGGGSKSTDSVRDTGFIDYRASGGLLGPRSSVGMHMANLAKGGKVPAMVSPGEIYLPPRQAEAVAKGKASPAVGEKIQGKAKVKGDSLKNDTVKKTLDEGGVVVPRTKAQDYDKAAAFVRAVMSKNKLR